MAGDDVELILAILLGYPGGLTRKELLAELRKGQPWIRPPQVEAAIATARERVKFVGDRLVLADTAVAGQEVAGRPLRLIAFDVESVVRPIRAEPYAERRTYQIGAVRFGRDLKWVRANRKFNRYVSMPADIETLLENPQVRERYFANKQEPRIALEEFRSFVEGADIVIAYNGGDLDFPLLRQEYARAALPPLDFPASADGYYLALALWPVPPRQHTLRQLRERLMLEVGEGRWHDALWDSHVLSILLGAGAKLVSGWDPNLQRLIRAASQSSSAWDVIFGLMPVPPAPTEMTFSEVADLLTNALASKPWIRTARGEVAPEPATFNLESSIQEEGQPGRVDVIKLARAAKGHDVEPRQSQRDMVEAMRIWVANGRDALVEAPTGTGKSYAMLAIALEWLTSSPQHRVVISTFTKQLQSQLAGDLQDLSGAGILPALDSVADLVKGQGNRLSLRAVVRTLADLTAPSTSRRLGRRTAQHLSADPRYRDLLMYLALRYLAQGKPIEEWESKSVDPADVPAFFESHCGGRNRLVFFLLTLSQANNGELAAGTGLLALHTSTVREALQRHRLVIANHALLLAHLDDFEGIGSDTLLMVDESHSLEDAATEALSFRFDYQGLEAVFGDIREWEAEQPPGEKLTALREAIGDLEKFLDNERLPISALNAFDTQPSDAIHVFPRKITVASSLAGRLHGQEMMALVSAMRACASFVYPVRTRLLDMPLPADRAERERFELLGQRVAALSDAIYRIARNGHEALGLEWPERHDLPAEVGPPSTTSIVLSEPETDGELIADEAEPRGEADVTTEPPVVETEEEVFNRVVWAEEGEEPGREVARRGRRFFRFTLGSSPIRLGAEEAYRRFITSFGPTYFVSATLRVADPRRGPWAYIRERLALPRDLVDEHSLPSPFDASKQARLVCFEDFPSWAEQGEMAVRTVAHQLSGYAQEMVRGNQNGAMVLTTSRESAARLADQLLRFRARLGADYEVSAAPIPLSNQRAVEEFKVSGGFLIGTRGLWQGVDIDKSERLCMVWINKLPFASFGDPVIEARRALVARQAELENVEDPEQAANERYYLPLAALQLRQAVGRLIRTKDHRGVVIISDRKLGGPTRLRRLYRQVFLGSLDEGLLVADPETKEPAGGNVVTMDQGWHRIWSFFAAERLLDPARATELCDEAALERQTLLPQVRAIREQTLGQEEFAQLQMRGAEAVVAELVHRAEIVGGYLALREEPIELKELQHRAIAEIARGKDVLAVLPTGYGKSFIFQLPALVLPGVTVVVSPLVSLMTDQALSLNRSIGGAVRALVAPMRESNSRTGKVEVQEQLTDPKCRHGIRIVYLSPERLCQRQFQDWLRDGVRRGIVQRIAIDEAHTFAQWGDDFRPSFRRAEMLLRKLKHERPELQLIGLTATANRAVRNDLIHGLFGIDRDQIGTHSRFALITSNPIRPELAIYRRRLAPSESGHVAVSGLVERVVDVLDEHAILYCLTIKQVEALYAHLSDYLGDERDRLRRFHGRMNEIEKASVANDFKAAAKKGEEGFRPMIVIATSAFGLGVDRPDIRTVFVVSPPTDLAALYQQLGRAGRDHRASFGLALADSHAFRVIRFMNQRRVDPRIHWQLAQAILDSAPVLDGRGLANRLALEELEAGRISQDDIEGDIEGRYLIEVMRVLAALSSDGLVEDLGDFPARADIRRGEIEPDSEGMREQVEAILESRSGATATVDLSDLFSAVHPQIEGEADDVGSFWSLLLQLHADGYLDVSQRSNMGGRYLTGLRVRSTDVNQKTIDRLGRRQRVLDEEYGYLSDWFEETRCCNEGLARYFMSEDARPIELPDGTCATPECRCSACWNRQTAVESEPRILVAFKEHKPKPASSQLTRKNEQMRLDRYVETLLWQSRRGLAQGLIHKVLRGESTYFSSTTKKAVRLWPELVNSRVFNVRPGLLQADLTASLERLEAAGIVVRDGGFWRLRRWVQKYGPNRPWAQAAAIS